MLLLAAMAASMACGRIQPTPDRVAGCVAISDGPAAEALSTAAATAPSRTEVYFSPMGGCTDAVVREIANAKRSIRVMAYSFTSTPIARALVEAHDRGVDVQVILDKSQETERYTGADFLVHAGIPTMIDDRHAIAHNKVIIIDDLTVITGSFNFTKAAEEKNVENLLVLDGQDLARRYVEQWAMHLVHSRAYVDHADRRPIPQPDHKPKETP